MRLAGLLRDILSDHPVEEYQWDSGKVGSPAAARRSRRRAGAGDRGADPPCRCDQAPGEDRHGRHLAQRRGVIDRPLVQAVLAAGAGRDVLGYKTLKVLADLDPAVAEVLGFTRYGIEGGTITVVDAADCRWGSPARRAATGPHGHQAHRRHQRAARRPRPQRRAHRHLRSRGQGERGDQHPLLRVRFEDRLGAATMPGVLQGYDRRYDRLVDWVSETEGGFDDRLLGELPGRRPAHRADLRRRRQLAVNKGRKDLPR